MGKVRPAASCTGNAFIMGAGSGVGSCTPAGTVVVTVVVMTGLGLGCGAVTTGAVGVVAGVGIKGAETSIGGLAYCGGCTSWD